jgi:hypothetical protein
VINVVSTRIPLCSKHHHNASETHSPSSSQVVCYRVSDVKSEEQKVQVNQHNRVNLLMTAMMIMTMKRRMATMIIMTMMMKRSMT